MCQERRRERLCQRAIGGERGDRGKTREREGEMRERLCGGGRERDQRESVRQRDERASRERGREGGSVP